MANYTYELDTTGELPANKIADERHTITGVNDRDYNFIVPKFAPFFAKSVKLYLEDGQNLLPLTEGVDWNTALEFQGASLSTGKPVCGAISFNRVDFSGQVLITYQTIGGEYTLDQTKLTELLTNIIYNPRGITWEEITGLPKMFPPIDHPWNFNDMVGMSDIKESIEKIAAAIAARTGQDISSHLHDFLNPHRTNKTIIGLSLVENYPPATITQGISGTSNASLITPMVLRAVLEELNLLQLSDILEAFRKHLEKHDNPHETNKSHVGLAQVENLPVASPTDILSRRKVRKYVTLDQLMEYLSLYGCKPTDNLDIEFAPKNSLLSAYCNNVNKLGVYADGNGGTYEKIIELNSLDCGYQIPTPIQHPVRGTLMRTYCSGVDQFAYYADGYGGIFSGINKLNSPECGYTGNNPSYPAAGTVLNTRCDGTTLIKTVADGKGGSTEQRELKSSQCAAPPPVNPPANMLIKAYCQGFDLKGDYSDGNGGTYTAIITRNSSECGYQPPVTPPPPGTNPPPPPPTNPPPYNPPPYNPPPPTQQDNINVSISLSKTSLAVGQSATLTVTYSGIRNYGTTYYFTILRSGVQHTTTNPIVGSASTSSGTFTIPIDNAGDITAGTYTFLCQVTNISTSLVKESNSLNLTFTANRAISLTLNGNSSYLDANIGTPINVAVNFQDFPINKITPWYLEMRGADSRDAGKGQLSFQANSSGSATQTITSGMLANTNVQGEVTYVAVAEWQEYYNGNGTRPQTTRSNSVVVRWAKTASPPPPAANMSVTYTSTHTVLTPGTNETITMTISNGQPNRTYTVDAYLYSTAIPAPQTRIGATVTITTNSSGYGQTFLRVLDDGVSIPRGVYQCWAFCREANVSSPQFTRTFTY